MTLELPRPIAFVMGGGGSLGAAQVGMLLALKEAGITPDLVVGTSVGSMNGAMVAARPDTAAEDLRVIWARTTRERIFPGSRFRQLLTWRDAKTFVVPNDGLFDFLGEVLPVDTFDQLALPFGAVACDTDTLEPVLLRTGLLRPALLASTAIPGVFPPVWSNGRMLCDGGIVANVPVQEAVTMGAASLVILDCFYPGRLPTASRTLLDVVAIAALALTRSVTRAELRDVGREHPVVYLPGPAITTVDPTVFTNTADLLAGALSACRTFLGAAHVEGPGVVGPVLD